MNKGETPNAIQATRSGPVRMRVVETGKEHSLIEIGVDYSKALPPERAYYADYCSVEKGRLAYSLCFGKLVTGTEQLRTMVEVSFPFEMFVKQLWASSREFSKSLESLKEKLNVGDLTAFVAKSTEKVQNFKSNNVFMGMWGEEAVLDFYYISPGDIHFVKMKSRTEIDLEPVLRVTMATQLIYEFLKKCEAFVEATTPLILEKGGK